MAINPDRHMTEDGSKNISVLLVDDDAFVRNVMSEMLKSLDVQQLTLASNGQEAVSLLATCKPDLIFCDLHMPGQDGFQLMEELANRHYEGAIVIVSGQKNHVLHSGEVMARFHLLDFLGALEKPVTRQQMQDILKKLATR